MSASFSELSDELRSNAIEISWRMWSDLGVPSWEQPVVKSVIELEPLIAFTALVGSADRRLLTQAVDWCVTNADLVSLHQLKQVVANRRWPFTGSIAEFGATVGHFTKKKWPGVQQELPFLQSVPQKSRLPDLRKPSLIALRFRAVFGVGARSEILRFLLFHPWPHSAQQIAREVPYGARQVSKDLHLLSLAGITRPEWEGRGSGYVLSDPGALVAIVGKPRAQTMPWEHVFRIMTELLEAFSDLGKQNLHAVDTELARRLRLLDRELRYLQREDWWVHPGRTTDDIAAWVSWLLAEIVGRV